MRRLRTPLGYRHDGAPFWGFAGAQDDEGGEQAPTGATDTDDTDDGDDNATDEQGLTAGGRKLIEAERNAAKEAKRALAPWRKLEREFGMGPDEIRAKLATADDESTRAKRDAEAEVTRRFTERLVKTEVRALARESFADPEDALLFLDLSTIEVDDDGEVDTKGIQRELKALLGRKPHLAKKSDDDDGGGGVVKGFDGGARRTVEPPKNMTAYIRSAVEAKRGRR